MRRWHFVAVLLLVPVLGAATPSEAGAERTQFYGQYFPAGLPGTGTECPHTWLDPAFCVIEMGSWTTLPSGRIRIRDMLIYELAFSWRADDDQVEPRKTGYDIVTANANLDDSFSGPTWGTWELHDFDDRLMFRGTFTGKFENGIPAVHFIGDGVEPYEGQHMSGDIGRVADPYNMFGRILEPGSN